MIRRPPRSTQGVSSAASDVYKRQLQWSHVDLDLEIITIRRTIYVDDRGQLQEKDTKTHQQRRVVLDPETAECSESIQRERSPVRPPWAARYAWRCAMNQSKGLRRLVINLRTVHLRLRSIFEKLGVTTRTAAAYVGWPAQPHVTPRPSDTVCGHAAARISGASTARR